MSQAFQVLFASLLCFSFFFAESVEAKPRRVREAVQTYGILGDAGWPASETVNLRRSLTRSKVDRLIMPGDNLYYPIAPSYDSAWGPWRRAGFEFPIVALGNHYLSVSAEMAYFNLESEYFTHVEGSSLFIVLNSDNESTVAEQARFLREQLDGALSQFVFVVFHHPPVTISRRHDWREKENFHNVIRPIIESYRSKVTAMIVGHDHVAGIYEINGIPMIVSGGSVEALPTGTAPARQGSTKIDTRWVYQNKPTWARMDVVPGENEVWVNFIEIGRERVTCSALITSRPVTLRSNCRARTPSRRADQNTNAERASKSRVISRR